MLQKKVNPMTRTMQNIPEGWSIKKLGDCVISTQLGGNYENAEDNKGIPLIKMGNMGRGFIKLDKVEYIPVTAEYSSSDVLHYGDVLFNTSFIA